MNSEKIKKDSKYEFNILSKLFDSSNTNIKKCFYYLLFKDLIQINNDDIEYSKTSTYDFINNSNDILLNYLDKIYFKLSNNDPDLLPFLKDNIIKKNNEIKLKLKECESHMDILKKNYDNILLLQYLPIKNNIKLFFDTKSVLMIEENKEFGLILSEFITRYIFSSIENDIKLNHKTNNLNKKINVLKSDNNISINKTNKINKINEIPILSGGEILNNLSLNNIFNSNNFYSKKNINNYINDKFEIKDFNLINYNFKYWFFLVTLISQIFSHKQSKYEHIFNETERDEYINNILAPKKKENDKKKKNKKNKKKKIKRGGGSFDKKKKLKDNNLIVNNSKLSPIFNKFKKKINSKSLDTSKNKLLNATTIKKSYYQIFLDCNINNTTLEKIYIHEYDNNIKSYFIKYITDDKLTTYNKNSALIHPFLKRQIPLKNIIKNFNDNQILSKSELINKINNEKLLFDIFDFLSTYREINNKTEINNFALNVKKKLILILYQLYDIKLGIYKNYISIINSLFDLKNNVTNPNNKKINNTIVLKKNEQTINNKSEEIVIKKKIEQNILNNSSVNINVKIKLLTEKLLEFKSKPISERDEIEELKYEDDLKKLYIEKYNKYALK